MFASILDINKKRQLETIKELDEVRGHNRLNNNCCALPSRVFVMLRLGKFEGGHTEETLSSSGVSLSMRDNVWSLNTSSIRKKTRFCG